MEKRKFQAGVILVFGVILAVRAMIGGHTEIGEMGQMQDAMRNLRRVDNLHFSYESKVYSVSATGEIGEIIDEDVERTEVWLDQLTGAWVAEYYTTDEDGTRPVMKQYCDGRIVYQYINWNGEWSLREDLSTEVPNLNSMISLDYDSNDITDAASVVEDGYQKISYTFTPEYLEDRNQVNIKEMEKTFSSYQKSGVSDAELRSAELAVEKLRRTSMREVNALYTINPDGILCNGVYSLIITEPELINTVSGRQLLGEEQTTQLLVEIDIEEYNQGGITNKIQQCQNELMY